MDYSISKKLLSVGNIKNQFFVVNTIGWLGFFLFNLLTRNQYLETVDDYIGLTSYYVVGYLCSFLVRMYYKKIRIRDKSIFKVGLFIILSSYLWGAIWFLADLGVSILIFGIERYARLFVVSIIVIRTFMPSLTMLVWSGLYFIVKYWRELNKEKDKSMETAMLLQEAELKLLRYQLNPHFLFNSLNSIRALTLQDPSQVRDMVTELSEFLKYSLLSKNKQEVPLQEEIKSIKHYFKIEHYRFQDNLIVEYDIDNFAEEYPVPVMLLHPIVENAVKYGMATSELPLKIYISAKVKENELSIEVKNNGRWIEEETELAELPSGTSTGLSNVKKRLKSLYPGNHSFEIEKTETEVIVKIRIINYPDVKND